MNFVEKLVTASRQHDSLLCVGLDPEASRVPPEFLGTSVESSVVRFCHAIIEATVPYVCAYKPNLAFFEVLGPRGMYVFQEVIKAIPTHIPIIADAKRGDIGNSARNYAATVFYVYGCDAATINPYLGHDSVAPYMLLFFQALWTKGWQGCSLPDRHCRGKTSCSTRLDR